jgi:hypothetical protein
MDSRLKPLSRASMDVAQPHCLPVSIFGAILMGVPPESAAGYQLPPRAELPAFDGPKVIYAAACLMGPDRLSAYPITVRQTPKQIRVA